MPDHTEQLTDARAAHDHASQPSTFTADHIPPSAAPLTTTSAIPRRDHDATATPIPSAVRPTPTAYTRFVKPLFDRAVALVLVVLFAPLLLAGMLAVRLTLGPGVFFVQQRVGQHGTIFSTYKLRTMAHDRRATSEEDLEAFRQGQWDGFERRRTHKSAADPRLNRVGGLLRKFSIDEIPQILNILKGDMSLVGPRPEIPGVVAKHYQPWMHRRHVVKPGLTGLWQVSERGNGMMHEHVDVDLDYVDSVGPWTDLKIVLLTPYAVLARRGF